jgi:hypothetical protein
MRKPPQHAAHKAMLTPALLAQHDRLSRAAPTFGRVAPDWYAEEARAYNAECERLGATLMMVVEL